RLTIQPYLLGRVTADVLHFLPCLYTVGVGLLVREVLAVVRIFRLFALLALALVDTPGLDCLVVAVFRVLALLLAHLGHILLHGLGGIRVCGSGCGVGGFLWTLGAWSAVRSWGAIAGWTWPGRLDDLGARHPLIAVVDTTVLVYPAKNVGL